MAWLFPIILMFCAAALWMAVRRIRRGRAAADDVIYLGYDDQDNVDSMHTAMLERLRRGEIRDSD